MPFYPRCTSFNFTIRILRTGVKKLFHWRTFFLQPKFKIAKRGYLVFLTFLISLRFSITWYQKLCFWALQIQWYCFQICPTFNYPSITWQLRVYLDNFFTIALIFNIFVWMLQIQWYHVQIYETFNCHLIT